MFNVIYWGICLVFALGTGDGFSFLPSPSLGAEDGFSFLGTGEENLLIAIANAAD
jgi:hypothetical protein